MRLTDDLTSPNAIFVKGWLFLVLGAMSGGALVCLEPRWDAAILIAITTWAFSRWYYFMFYVIEHYTDPTFKFSGLGSFIRYILRRPKNAPQSEIKNESCRWASDTENAP